MARGDDRGTWGGPSDTGRNWPPPGRPRTREEARADLDRRTDERDIDRRHDWRGGGRPREVEGRRRDWPPAHRPRSREEARADLDRRTDERDIDRRHDWRGGGSAPGRMSSGRMAPPRSREELRTDLDRRTDADTINRRHAWGGGEYGYRAIDRGEDREFRGRRPPRGFAGPDWVENEPDIRRAMGRGPGGRVEERFDERPYLAGEGEEAVEGEEAFESSWGFRESPYSSGYGGYGGGEYGGSYGGFGPGRTGTYSPTYSTGIGGGGSILGEAGNVSGWQETHEMGPRSTASMLERAARRGWAREGPLVRDVMTRNPRSVGPDDTVVQAAKAMREEDAGIIPVTRDGRVIGVVTDRDLAMRVLAEGKGGDARISQVMSEDVHVCTQDDRLVDAVRVMGEENLRRLPVVDRDDRLLGILSMTDVAREAELDYALQEALEQLASRRSFWSRW